MLRKVLIDYLEIPFSKAAKLALPRFSQCLPGRLILSQLWSKNNRYAISKGLQHSGMRKIKNRIRLSNYLFRQSAGKSQQLRLAERSGHYLQTDGQACGVLPDRHRNSGYTRQRGLNGEDVR